MKVLLLLFLVVLATAETDHDGDIFDQFDVIEILDNDKERLAVMDCLLKRSPCGVYQPFKDKGNSILATRCEDCTPEQKAKFEEAINKFETEHYDEYKQLMSQFKITV